MKSFFFLVSLFCLSGCGSDAPKSDLPQASVTPSPTPTPEVKAESQDPSLVGNWVMGSNTLSFAANNLVFVNGSELSYSISGASVEFLKDKVKVDLCAYSVATSGSLTSTLQTFLNLVCDRAGILTYSKAP